MNQFITGLKKLIAEDKTAVVLAVLSDFLEERDRDLYDQCILHQGNFKKTEENRSLKLISGSEATQSYAQLNHALITLLTDVEKLNFDDKACLKRLRDIEAEMTIKNLPQKNTKKYIYWGIGGVGLLIVLIYAILQMMIIPKVDKFVVAKAYLDEATKLRSNGKFEEAILKCNKGLEYKPDYADIYNLRAECYLNLNQPTRGFEDIKKAIDIDSVDITGMLHSTAAQIYAEMYSPPNDYFYSYFEYSLKCKLPLWDYMDEPGFRRVKDDKKVKELLEKYKY